MTTKKVLLLRAATGAALAAGALAVEIPSAHAAFPGANGRIAFADLTLNDSPFTRGIARMQVRTVAPSRPGSRVLTPSSEHASDPTFSPYGRWIAYVRRVGTGDREIYRIRANGRRQQAVTHDDRDDTSPAWSPAGRRIVFIGHTPNGPEIFVVRRDGTRLRRLTHNRLTEQAPAWSPNGRWIAFTRETRRRGTAIFRMRPDGRQVQRVTAGEFPSWSPDSRRIAFDDRARGSAGSALRDIYTVRPNGRDRRRVTHDPRDDVRPAWSPDGTTIVFKRDLSTLWLVSPRGGDQRRVFAAGPPAAGSDVLHTVGPPSWQPL